MSRESGPSELASEASTRLVTTLKTLADASMITQNAVNSLFIRHGPPFSNHSDGIRAYEILP